MLRRRPFLTSLLAFAGPSVATARALRSAGSPLLVGVDRALMDSGLVPALKRGFAADTGIAVRLVAAPALTVLDAVQNGEVDAALTNAPAAESDLDRQGLVHDLRPIVSGEFVVVGPRPSVRGRSPAASHSAAALLTTLRDAALIAPGGFVFLSSGDRSGTHVAEQALWSQARIAPGAPWYQTADASGSFVAQVRARGAHALVERGAWAALGGPPQAILVEGDPALAETVHAMRSFRVTHPAGKIFVAWIAGRRGRAIAASHRGYRTV